MSKAAALHHLAGLLAGVAFAAYKGDWTFVEIQLGAQLAVIALRFMVPNLGGGPSPRQLMAQQAYRLAGRLEERRGPAEL